MIRRRRANAPHDAGGNQRNLLDKAVREPDPSQPDEMGQRAS
jgi:hypothetical protein